MNYTTANLSTPFLPLSDPPLWLTLMCATSDAIILAVIKLRSHLLALLATLTLALVPSVDAQIAPGELVAPKLEMSGGNLNFTVQPSLAGRNYRLQCSDTMAGGTWTDVGVVRSGDGGNLVMSHPYESAVQRRFFRVVIVEATRAPEGFSLITAGSFEMGQTGIVHAEPVHSVYVSAFYMGKYEVTKELWDAVKTWGASNGYTDLPVGNGSYVSKGANHPVHSINWFAMVKWCNARSQKEGLTPCYYTDAAQTVASICKTGQPYIVNTMVKWSANGYRLPTEAEWEKAARGGLSGKLFPWGNTISHSQANYSVYSSNGKTNYYSYDVTPRPPGKVYDYYHPTYAVNGDPYTSPVGSFDPNGYGLYDMAGNLLEWCWDEYGIYTSDAQVDPRGYVDGSAPVIRGGGWYDSAYDARCAYRNIKTSDGSNRYIGFRLARGQP